MAIDADAWVGQTVLIYSHDSHIAHVGLCCGATDSRVLKDAFFFLVGTSNLNWIGLICSQEVISSGNRNDWDWSSFEKISTPISVSLRGRDMVVWKLSLPTENCYLKSLCKKEPNGS